MGTVQSIATGGPCCCQRGAAKVRLVPLLLLRFARHPDDGEFLGVALKITAQPLAKRAGVAGVRLYSRALLVELARGDDYALPSPRRSARAVV